MHESLLAKAEGKDSSSASVPCLNEAAQCRGTGRFGQQQIYCSFSRLHCHLLLFVVVAIVPLPLLLLLLCRVTSSSSADRREARQQPHEGITQLNRIAFSCLDYSITTNALR